VDKRKMSQNGHKTLVNDSTLRWHDPIRDLCDIAQHTSSDSAAPVGIASRANSILPRRQAIANRGHPLRAAWSASQGTGNVFGEELGDQIPLLIRELWLGLRPGRRSSADFAGPRRRRAQADRRAAAGGADHRPRWGSGPAGELSSLGISSGLAECSLLRPGSGSRPTRDRRRPGLDD
jgi:hypothetical protein